MNKLWMQELIDVAVKLEKKNNLQLLDMLFDYATSFILNPCLSRNFLMFQHSSTAIIFDIIKNLTFSVLLYLCEAHVICKQIIQTTQEGLTKQT